MRSVARMKTIILKGSIDLTQTPHLLQIFGCHTRTILDAIFFIILNKLPVR